MRGRTPHRPPAAQFSAGVRASLAHYRTEERVELTETPLTGTLTTMLVNGRRLTVQEVQQLDQVPLHEVAAVLGRIRWRDDIARALAVRDQTAARAEEIRAAPLVVLGWGGDA